MHLLHPPSRRPPPRPRPHPHRHRYAAWRARRLLQLTRARFERWQVLAPTKTIAEIVLELLAKQRRDGSWTADAAEQLTADLGDRRILCAPADARRTPTESVLEFLKSDAVAKDEVLAAIVARAIARAEAFQSSQP